MISSTLAASVVQEVYGLRGAITTKKVSGGSSGTPFTEVNVQVVPSRAPIISEPPVNITTTTSEPTTCMADEPRTASVGPMSQRSVTSPSPEHVASSIQALLLRLPRQVSSFGVRFRFTQTDVWA